MAAGIAILEGALRPVDRAHAATCLQKLAVGFNMAQTAAEARLRLEVWLEANGDLPGDLWTLGTVELLRTYKFGMPKPPHLREVIDSELSARQADLRRAKEMLEHAASAAKPEREPREVRLRTMRDSFRKYGDILKAAHYEKTLAKLEGREVEGWALEPMPQPEPATVGALVDALPKISPEVEAQTLLSVAKRHRAQGQTVYAAFLTAQAKKLAPALFEE